MKPLKVLVVDDVNSARLLAKRFLTRHGFEVVDVGTAADALIKLTDNSYSAIVADLRLKNGGDGLTLLKIVKRWYPDVAKILWTAVPGGCDINTDPEITCVYKAGSHRVLVKALKDALGLTLEQE